MKAIVETKGHQFTVAEGDILKVDTFADSKEGDTVQLDKVLAAGVGASMRFGTPYLEGVEVKARILAQTRAPKIIIFKKKRRKGYERKQGHRQNLSVIKIESIN